MTAGQCTDCKRHRPFYRERLNEIAGGNDDHRIGFHECAIRIWGN